MVSNCVLAVSDLPEMLVENIGSWAAGIYDLVREGAD